MPSNSRMNLTALRAARYPGRHAAGTGERAEMIRDSSWREVPRISRDLTSRSRDTEGSPASIFAMRDWLDWRRLARSACVRLRRRRRSRRPMANRALRSIYAASSALRRRNSLAFPNFQPFASKRRRFGSRMVVLPQPASARVNDGLRCGACLLGEDLQNHHGVGVQAVHDSPVRLRVAHSQFMTTGTHNGHRPRLRHAHRLPLLQQAQQITGLHPGRPGKGRGLDLTVKPGERLVARAHGDHPMSNPTCSQMVASILRITPACSRRPPAAVDTDVRCTSSMELYSQHRRFLTSTWLLLLARFGVAVQGGLLVLLL